jgi:hypothetical protein
VEFSSRRQVVTGGGTVASVVCCTDVRVEDLGEQSVTSSEFKLIFTVIRVAFRRDHLLPSDRGGRDLINREVGIVNQLWEEKLFQMAVGDEAISTDRICCLRKVLGKTLLVSLPQKYLLPYRDQLSSQGTLYRVLLSPKSQDHFSFWPFAMKTRPCAPGKIKRSASVNLPKHLAGAIRLFFCGVNLSRALIGRKSGELSR